jgi:1,4-alpha-glucan branching enzyme
MQSEQGLNRWGALRLESGAVRFRLWASGQQQITLKVVGNEYPMTSVGDGWFEQTNSMIPWLARHSAPE